MSRIRLLTGLLAATLWVSACVGHYESAFPVVVVNRTINSIDVLANGSSIGQVATGQSGSFTLNLRETNTNTYAAGVAPTSQAEVVFSAKDLKTGAISSAKSLTLTQNPPTYITFSAADFPVVAPTVARFATSPNNPGVNQDVFFNASTSTATNATYVWDFGDGTTANGITTTHRYQVTGTFTVVLIVTSDNGQSSTSSRTITISAGLPPTAANFIFSPTTPGVNQNVVFTATAIPGATFTWDFGDGSITTGASTTHQYTRSGTFSVTLRVSNDIGQSSTSSRSITVSASLPAGTAAFTFSPTNPAAGDTVFFNASSSLVINGNFRWDFGDGSGGTGVTPTHQFARGATYTVTLTVTNDIGQSAVVSHTVTVTESTFVVDFSFSPTDPTIATGTNAVIFDASGSGPGVTSWTWEFGDGTAAGSGQRVTHTFTRAGTWVVRLTIADAAGRTATTTKSVTVKP